MSESINSAFEELVALNFQLYNGLFLTLPLDAVEQTGLLLPLLEADCEKGLVQNKNPSCIIEEFFSTHKPHFSEAQQIAFLFKVIQYVERQVVLMDALEDAAYSRLHETQKFSVLHQIIERVKTDKLQARFSDVLKNFGIRVILTAHPTQFYPGPVLGIINDLTKAISDNTIFEIRELLMQLGNTRFFRKQKPSPFDEAVLLTWYLGNIFYPVIGKMVDRLAEQYSDEINFNRRLMTIGFWPGGDRDGNPFVTVDITRRVAAKLRYTIAGCYHRDIRELKRRLTFSGIYESLEKIEAALHQELSETRPNYLLNIDALLEELNRIEKLLLKNHQGLFVERLRSLRRKVNLFGFYFASLDIRQDSSVIHRSLQEIVNRNPELFPPALDQQTESAQIASLMGIRTAIDINVFTEPVLLDTLKSFAVVGEIQQQNGEFGCHRYVISNCHGPVDIARAYAMFRLCGWPHRQLTVDIVPLFESVRDLEQAGNTMYSMYQDSAYRAHLELRGNRQTVMLGFSDGTKDGGYLMANWAIYRAKEDLTRVSRAVGIEVLFFDGRGGPPARGGGSAYLFYAALGRKIESNQIQMTVQGQTVSSHYGIKQAAEHNLGLLLSAGLENNVYDRPERELGDLQRELIQSLASVSYETYKSFKSHPLFMSYLEEMSTLNYYSQANIGSRPVKRGNAAQLRFEDLRAIPFVGAWAQLKQNVPGYFGLGSALKALESEQRLSDCISLYQESAFFRALIANAMQNLAKSNFLLTQYMQQDKKFGEFWTMIFNEFELSREMVLKISNQKILLEDNPRARRSIELRERIVRPLLVLQQHALIKTRALRDKKDGELLGKYEKMVVRSLYGNINASRNSA
jgi:phosphoenolpyruvate carboxylase